MRVFSLFLALLTTAFAEPILLDTATIYIQSLSSSSSPNPLAEINYNPSTLSASIASFEPPEIIPGSKNVKIGVYDPAAGSWKSATSLTSMQSFAKGYRPTLVLSLDGEGSIMGVSVSSGKIDPGQTRDFGPRVLVKGMGASKGPVLNKPVVLSAEGKVAQPEPEKTLLQKYWWVLLGGVMLLMTAGGGGD